MKLRKWNDLPLFMKVDEVRVYYDILRKRQISLILKRFFDIVFSTISLIILSPLFVFLAIVIKMDSPGPIFYRQVRITQYGKKFRIFKFRTMFQNADGVNTQITVGNDIRITKVGVFLRKYRFDEFSQLLNVLMGSMTLVGTRPEVPKYVAQYSSEMLSTLLLPAGITSEASIFYKDESDLLNETEDIEKIYVEKILLDKMFYNLREITNFSLINDLRILFMTFYVAIGRDKSNKHLTNLPNRKVVNDKT